MPGTGRSSGEQHVEIADLLLAGRTADAAEAMRRHLDTVGQEKTAT